jgi:hypothetical protein
MKASTRIKYPKRIREPPTSINAKVPLSAVLTSIISLLSNVVDNVELIKPEHQKTFCDAIVDGANSLTSVFEETQKKVHIPDESQYRLLPGC